MDHGGHAAGGFAIYLAVAEHAGGTVRVTHHPAIPAEIAARWGTVRLTDDVPACQAIRTGLPVLLRSREELGRQFPGGTGEFASAGFAALAAVPLRSASGQTLGAAGFAWQRAQGFAAAQTRRLDLVGQLAGLALERALAAEPGPAHEPGSPQAAESSQAAGSSQAAESSHDEPLTRALEAALQKAERSNARLSFLTELSSRLAGAGTRTEVLERLSRVVVPLLADWCTVVVPRGQELVRVAAQHDDPALDRLAKRLVDSYPHSFSGPSPGVVVYRSGQPLQLRRLAQQIITDLDDSGASAAYGRTMMLLGDGPGLITPVISGGAVVAVLTMVRSAGGRFAAAEGGAFTDDDVTVVQEAAERVAVALDHARHAETQRETASALQAAALPASLPVAVGLSLAAAYRAASEGSQVGGDWYDALDLRAGRVSLVVGDVAGHGLQAAAVMTQLRNVLRAHLFDSLGPAESLVRLSALLAVQEPAALATIICVQIDPVTGEVTWSSAGHPAPILVSREGTSAYLPGRPAPPVGVTHLESVARPLEHRLVLEAGDRLLLFTDGLIEQRGVGFDIGLAHLMILAEQTGATSDAGAACETIMQEVLPGEHEDDACLLIADYRP